MKKKRLLLDVDEVIVFSGFVEAINDFLGTNYTIDDFTDYYIDIKVVPEEKLSEFYEFISKRNLYKYSSLLPGAIESIKKLNEIYDIYILSSCVNETDIKGSGRIFMDKYDFLLEHLPFINPKRFIFTGSKSLIQGDIKIDDLVDNFYEGDSELKILFPSYHNKDVSDEELKEKGIIRLGRDWRTGWSEILEYLLKIK